MAKVKFDLTFKDDIIKGSAKLVTADGHDITHASWVSGNDYCLVGKVEDLTCVWKNDGSCCNGHTALDLFVIVKDKELTAYDLLFDSIIAKASCINTDITLETFYKWKDDLKQAAVKDFFDWKYLLDGVSYTKDTAYTFSDYLRVGNYVTDLKKIADTVPDE